MDIICRYFPITRVLFGWVILDIGGGLLQNPCDVWIAELDELDERESQSGDKLSGHLNFDVLIRLTLSALLPIS